MALGNLVNAVNQYIGTAENTPKNLDGALSGDPNTVVNFGALGDFSKQIDQSAHRQYIETGFIRNIRPRQSEILMQEPDITILVKKRMFSSLVENFKPELMDSQEKLFYRATKRLFQNKCSAIAAYERLSKVDRIISNNGVLNDYLFPIITTAADTLSSSGNTFGSDTRSTLDTLQKLKAFSDPNYLTTWLVSSNLPGLSDLGDGTGVIEFTNVSSVNCTTSTLFGQGEASLTIEDPYKLMVITNEDIDKAIKDTAAGFLSNSFFTVSQNTLEDTVTQLRSQLTSIRSSRGASSIQFIVDEDSLLFNKVRAIIDSEGREILFNYNGGLSGIGADVDIDASAFEGTNGLATNEINTFKQIIKNLFVIIGMQQSTQVNNFQFNSSTNYVRRKMRLNFGGKPIIQPMDIINVFVSTKSTIDPKSASVIASSFSGSDIFSAINGAVSGIENTLDSITSAFGGNQFGQSYAVAEKDAIAGSDFPMWLWNMLRNDFTRQAAGTHIFAGIVSRGRHTYSNGKYELSVSATDNCGYFKFGQININPSAEVYNHALYDPLTPFQLDFDPSSGFLNNEEPPLLQENIQLLNSGLLKFKNGRNRGYPANSTNYSSFDVEMVKNSSSVTTVRRKYEDPDGLIYRWKEGIQSLTLLGEPHPTGEFPSDSSRNLNKSPFAGQDVMNVLSFLITGTPYNFNTFMQAAIKSGSMTRDDLANDGGSQSFFRGLLSDISKQNSTWGNFVPFKKLVLNQSAYNFMRSGQLDITATNRKVTQLLQERAQRFDLLVKSAPYFANNPQFLNVDASGNLVQSASAVAGLNSAVANSPVADPAAITKLSSDILQLDFQISQAQQAFQDSITNSNINTTDGSIQIFGDDVSYDSTVNQTPSGSSQSDVDRAQSEFRKKLFYLTQRRLWKVKANEDQNLFIVDDQYDKNYDIQAFTKELSGNLEPFKSNYTDPAQQITMVAEILGLEVFADSQGNIQARPPAYNRMPTSVFNKMLATKSVTGVQIFPPYLESLFTNQIKGLSDQIEITEDQIRIRAAVLGYTTDQSAKGLLSGVVQGGGNTNFGFATNESDGKFGGKDVRVFLDQVNPDFTGSDTSTALKSIGSAINTLGATIAQVQAGVNFDIVQRINIVNKTQFGTGASDQDIDNRVAIVGKRLLASTGQTPPTRATLLSSDSLNTGSGISQLDVLNVTQQIAQFLSDRQSNLKLMANAIKNLGDGINLNTSNDTGQTALLPFLNKNKTIPSIIEHMLEDEDVDDLGFNSGKRYIISDNQIINYTIVEEPPAHTTVEVTGLFGEGTAGDNPIDGFDTGGGNPISTAWAVDFDMWRMYGFRAPQTIQAPFLSNPDTQCAPYAVFLLNRARKEIFQAEMTIAGNEFIQPGEVYYIEDEDLLFYTEKVNHSFNYGSGTGGTYTTSMTLKYGHHPGEYIPTILDIIGKGLYTNKNQANLVRHNRHGTSNGDVALGTIVFDANLDNDGDATVNVSSTPIQDLVSGSYGDQNRKSLGNILLAASGALNPTTSGKKAVLELRTYYDSANGVDANINLIKLAGSIEDWLTNPSKVDIGSSSGNLLPDQSVDATNTSQIVDSSVITLAQIDLSDDSIAVSPSQGAINKAKEIASTSGMQLPTSASPDVDQLDPNVRPILFQQIVDIWITYSPQDQTIEIPKTAAQIQSEAAQQNFAQALSAFTAKINSQTGS